MSSRSKVLTTGDGLCFVQPVLKRGAVSGHASGNEVGRAAWQLLQTCVVERGMGGVAFNIGECPTMIILPFEFSASMEDLNFERIPLKITSTLGGDNNVNVVIASYRPNVQCDTTPTLGPPWNSTVAIFSSMRASKRFRVFGINGAPEVEEGLPLVLEAGEKAKLMTTSGHKRTARLIVLFPVPGQLMGRAI